MKVTLLNHAEGRYLYTNSDNTNYEYLVQQAAAICVDKLDNPTKKGMMIALDSGHLSIIEHLPMTFLVEGVSRALTHQLVRHRIASYSQQSQRYAKVNTNEEWYITPESISNYAQYEMFEIYAEAYQSLNHAYKDLMLHIEEFYNMACKLGIPNEDARYILPNACFTSIIVTLNARSFIEQCEKRLCNKAQWEIRTMYKEMRNLIKDIYPTVYQLAKPHCMKSKCKEKYQCKDKYANLD